jgi:hypothetical protein
MTTLNDVDDSMVAWKIPTICMGVDDPASPRMPHQLSRDRRLWGYLTTPERRATSYWQL